VHAVTGLQVTEATEAPMMSNRESVSGNGGELVPAAIVELLDTGDSGVPACAVLTPAIKAELTRLRPGQILLVRTDDPSARLDVRAWCNLTGNLLQAEEESENGVLSFYIRKESKR
jgi:TusA-related sulfurtransferase